MPGSPRTSSCLNNTQEPRGLVPVGDQSVDFLLDAGAALSVLTGAPGPLSSQSTAGMVSSGQAKHCYFSHPLSCNWDPGLFSHEFLVVPESPSPLLGKDILSKVRVSVFMNMELALSLPSTEQNLNLKCGPMEKQWSNTKCCPCHYQAQRLSPISTSKAIPTKACNEGLKHIIGNLREQGLLIPCNSPCNTPILGVKSQMINGD